VNVTNDLRSNSDVVAHVRVGDSGAWVVHSLMEHLHEVARLSADFAAPFGNSDWAYLAGLWHDLGKYKSDFQAYIRDRSGFERDETDEGGPGKVDHTAAGAIHSVEQIGPKGIVLAYLIAGHHSGLPDWVKEDAPGRGLSERLADRRHLDETLQQRPPADLLTMTPPTSTPCGTTFTSTEHVHLWLRMLFSCLVDSDFLDTEMFMEPAKPAARGSMLTLSTLKERFDDFMLHKQSDAADTLVNRARRRILEDCRRAASKPPGLFSLTVPTGGGKTLASVGFALEHALKHGKRRVVIAIPYTSIIEQTAEVLRSVFGNDAVLEHHSNLDPDRETLRSKLATENWDAPIVVTTNVQLFESLYAARTSACRKLHNLANSVVILDEAQMLPPEFLRPILSALKGLSAHFGVTVLLCTATQPALEGRIGSQRAAFDGLSGVVEIIEDREALAKALRRVRLVSRGGLDRATSWEDLAGDAARHDQVLCVVNTRRDCRELHALMPPETVHLSALMCGEHRSVVIARVKACLRVGDAARVVSTQLIEAGVDIDFPIVYRALAGFDSIAQAAGRCNREGLLPNAELGKVIVFAPPKPAPAGLLRKGADAAGEMFRCFPDLVEAMSPDAFRKYFELFYGRVNSFDAKDIDGLLNGPDVRAFKLQFRTAARRFQLIDDAGQKAIIVWYAGVRFDSRELLDELKRFGPRRDRMRRLQRCVVTVPEAVWKALREQGAIEEIRGPDGPLDLWAQCVPGLYDETFGLRLDGPVFQGDEFIC